MKKLILIAFMIVLTISVTSISAQSSYEIPSWVKGIALFWVEGNITDEEFGESLAFLINSDTITVPQIEQLEWKINQLEQENDQLRKDLAQAYDKPKSDFAKPLAPQCDSSYPDVCIAPYPPDLNCGDIGYSNFRVVGPDPHGFDRDNDGIGCES